MLDPIADKALLVSMFITLAAVDILPDWLAILVVFRDVLIVGGVLLLAVLGQPAESGRCRSPRSTRRCRSSSWPWRCCWRGFDLAAPGVLDVLIWSVATTTLASGSLYVWKAARSR